MKVVQLKALIKAAHESKKPVNSQLFHKNKTTGEYFLFRDYGPREVSICQSNRFALRTLVERGGESIYTNSWCDFPKASELQELSFNMELYSSVAQITFEFGKLIYYFNK